MQGNNLDAGTFVWLRNLHIVSIKKFCPKMVLLLQYMVWVAIYIINPAITVLVVINVRLVYKILLYSVACYLDVSLIRH